MTKLPVSIWRESATFVPVKHVTLRLTRLVRGSLYLRHRTETPCRRI